MSTTTKQIRDWVKARRARNGDEITMALILEVIELRAKVEKLGAAQEQGFLAKLGRRK